MLETYLPEDFESFWHQTLYEANEHPLSYEKAFAVDHALEGFVIETLTFQGMRNVSYHGWIAYPNSCRPGHLFPGFLWLPHYGRNSMLPNEYGTREGYVSLSFNLLGHSSFHREEYLPERGYFALGIESPHDWIYREMFQNTVIALRILESLDAVHDERLASMGMSQGGGMSIWLGAFCPQIRVVCADMPFLTDMRGLFSKPIYRYPIKEVADYINGDPHRQEAVLHTLSYFDTLNFAKYCNIPTQVSYGLKDPASPPATVRDLYEVLPGHKRIIEYEIGHDWHPNMVENNEAFLNANL